MKLICAEKISSKVKAFLCDLIEKGVENVEITEFNILFQRVLASCPPVPTWHKFPEEYPEEEVPVLAIVNGRYKNLRFENAIEIAIYEEREGWYLDAYIDADVTVSHWMSLPEHPGEGEKNES